jgi:hypothetical protein
MNQATQDQSAATATPTVRILKVGTCTNLTGKSSLSYHIGSDENQDIVLRVASNSGGGFFSPEWVSLKSIQTALEKFPSPVTSYALFPLFKGKSANTPGFLFAALLAEGLVQRDEDNPRRYVVMVPGTLLAEIDVLMASGVDLKVEEPMVKPKKKPAILPPVLPIKKSPAAKKPPSKSGSKKALPDANKD